MKNIDLTVKYLWHIAFFPWLITLIFVFFGFSNIQRSMQVKNFETVPAHIENFQVDRKIGGRRIEEYYTYDLFWTNDGQEFSKHVDHSSERPNPKLTQVYVNADNTDVAVHNSLYYLFYAIQYLLLALISYILGLIVLKKCYPLGEDIRKPRRQERERK